MNATDENCKDMEWKQSLEGMFSWKVRDGMWGRLSDILYIVQSKAPLIGTFL